MRRLSFGLSRQLWVVEAGVFLNMLGYGAVREIITCTSRGEVAGLVVGLVSGVAIFVAPVAGAVVDRVGARTTAVGAGLALAGGYGSLAFATTPTAAFAAAALAGVGNGGLNPSQSALMAALAPRELRQRASAVSRVAVNVGIGLGAAIGGVVAGFGLDGFMLLFLANAVTYLVYLAILVAAVRDEVRPEPVAGGYRQVMRDRALLRFTLINVAMIAVGWGVLAWMVPPYAREIGIGPSLIGLLLLANAATVVLRPASDREGRRGQKPRRRPLARSRHLGRRLPPRRPRAGSKPRARLRLSDRGGGRLRRRRVSTCDRVHAADRRPGAACVTRAIHGDRRSVLVAGTRPRPDAGRAALGGLTVVGTDRRRRAGGFGDRPPAGL